MELLKDHCYTKSLFGKSILIEPISRRLKVYDLPSMRMLQSFMKAMKLLGHKHHCDKLIFYVRDSEKAFVKKYASRFEGMIKSFFNGKDAFIYAIFLYPERNNEILSKAEQNVLKLVKGRVKKDHFFHLPPGYRMRWAKKTDASQMALLYETVFDTYPTPMNEPEFIKSMMDEGVYFLIVENEHFIVSACSAEIMKSFKAAELSDCVTYDVHRKKQLLSYQVAHLFPLLKNMGVRTVYSYSRSVSIGMNLVNVKHGFTFGGRMIKNSNISGNLENMNIWYKNI